MRVLIFVVMIVINVSGNKTKNPLTKLVKKPPGWVGLDSDHKINKRKADNHNHNSYGAPVSTSYGSPAPAEDSVDLHNKEFCVDVSTYQPVVWVERDGEECKTDFVKQCEEKSEEVCAEVHETRCEVCLQDKTLNS